MIPLLNCQSSFPDLKIDYFRPFLWILSRLALDHIAQLFYNNLGHWKMQSLPAADPAGRLSLYTASPLGIPADPTTMLLVRFPQGHFYLF